MRKSEILSHIGSFPSFVQAALIVANDDMFSLMSCVLQNSKHAGESCINEQELVSRRRRYVFRFIATIQRRNVDFLRNRLRHQEERSVRGCVRRLPSSSSRIVRRCQLYDGKIMGVFHLLFFHVGPSRDDRRFEVSILKQVEIFV